MWVKTLLLLAGLVSVMCTGAIAPALPYMADHYSFLSNASLMMRFVVTTPHLVICIASIPVGWALGYVDRVLAMVVAIFIYSICGTACFFFENIIVIISLRAILGLCISVVLSASSTLIPDIFQGRERKMTIGLQTTFMSVGTISYNLLSGFITDTFSWRYNFLLYSMPVILIPLAFRYLYPLDNSIKCRRSFANNKSKTAVNSSTSSCNIQDRFMICVILLLSMFNMMMYYMIPLQLSFFLKTFPGVGAKQISFAFGIETLVAAVSAAVYRKINDKISRFEYISVLALLSMGICYYLFNNVSSYHHVLLLMPLYGFGMGIMMPNLTMWLMNVSAVSSRGIIMGCFYSFLYLGKFMCSLWLDLLHRFICLQDIRCSYVIASEMLLFTSVIILFLLLRNKRKESKAIAGCINS